MEMEGSLAQHNSSFWRRRHDMSDSDGLLSSVSFEVLAFGFGVSK